MWDDIHKSQLQIYENICEALLKEQNNLCGYTELPLNNKHIDHHHKRVLYPEKCFCRDNLIMATLDDDFGARYKDKRLRGMRKLNGTDKTAHG